MKSRVPSILWLVLLCLASFVAGAGCQSHSLSKIDLPDISATSLTYRRTDPAGGTVIEAKGVVDHGTHVTADKVKLTTIYPAFSITVDVEGYRRTKPVATPAAAPAPHETVSIQPGAFVPAPARTLGRDEPVPSLWEDPRVTHAIALPMITDLTTDRVSTSR